MKPILMPILSRKMPAKKAAAKKTTRRKRDPQSERYAARFHEQRVRAEDVQAAQRVRDEANGIGGAARRINGRKAAKRRKS